MEGMQGGGEACDRTVPFDRPTPLSFFLTSMLYAQRFPAHRTTHAATFLCFLYLSDHIVHLVPLLRGTAMAPDGKYFTKTRKVPIHSNKRIFVTCTNDSQEVRRILGKWKKYWSFGMEDEKFVGLDLEYRKKTEELDDVDHTFAWEP